MHYREAWLKFGANMAVLRSACILGALFLLKIDQKKCDGHNAYDYLIVGTIAIVI